MTSQTSASRRDPERLSALIAVHSATLRAGLRALLSVVPQVVVVAEAESMPALLALAALHRPRLLLADLGPDPVADWQRLRELHTVAPACSRIVLVDELPLPGAPDGAAEAVLLKGTTPAALLRVIEQLVSKTRLGGAHGAPPGTSEKGVNHDH